MRDWVSILSDVNASLLVSTYQAGKLVVIGVSEGELTVSHHSFERAMGVAVRPDRIFVGTERQIWVLARAPEPAPGPDPAARHDAAYLPRLAHDTGEIRVHELACAGDELWVVNTLFSCICTLDGRHSFVPRWRPPFVSELAAEDRCHLNGLAVDDSGPRYVTAKGETDTPMGWRPGRATDGCLIDVSSGETVLRGLSMPHSPRVHQGRVWLLESGRSGLLVADPPSGRHETVAELPGFTRGLALLGSLAFVGLSKSRESSAAAFRDLPISSRRAAMMCGVAAVDLESGRPVALLELRGGVEEIFDVQLLPGIRSPLVRGPHPERDDLAPVWVLPGTPVRPSR